MTIPDDVVMRAFLNRLRSLNNIDGDQLPELLPVQQREFVRDPVRYFKTTTTERQRAIWREIERRQTVRLVIEGEVK